MFRWKNARAVRTLIEPPCPEFTRCKLAVFPIIHAVREMNNDKICKLSVPRWLSLHLTHKGRFVHSRRVARQREGVHFANPTPLLASLFILLDGDGVIDLKVESYVNILCPSPLSSSFLSLLLLTQIFVARRRSDFFICTGLFPMGNNLVLISSSEILWPRISSTRAL